MDKLQEKPGTLSTDTSIWQLVEDSFDPVKLHHKETLFTIGNGYLATRGVFEEGFPDECRTTFVHGVFDDVPVFFTELANTPDWLQLEIYLDGERFSLDTGTIHSYTRSLDLHTGLLRREVKWTSLSGKTAGLVFERFTSFAEDHLLCLRCQVVPQFDGQIEFRLGLNGEVENFHTPHWCWINQGITDDNIVYLQSQTLVTHIMLALAMRVEASIDPVEDKFDLVRNCPQRSLVYSARRGQEITISKFAGIATTRETHEPLKMAIEQARLVDSWDNAFESNRQAWQEAWQRMDIIIEGDEEAQLAARASLYQLLIAAPRHDNRVNIAAKTLSGFGYRGHSFWDTEIFMLPTFIYTWPEIARNLLDYRYQRLDAAHKKARDNGYEGAQFPWESAGTGEEVTPRWVPDFTNPGSLVRIWTGDIEIHISADIAFASVLYWKTTGDDAWFIEKGAELVLDTAKFWASRAEWNATEQRFEYNNVIGPDEYHDHVDNNFYTNFMARWNLNTALEVLDWLRRASPTRADELTRRLSLNSRELEKWARVRDRIYLHILPDGLIEQFEGYFELKDIDLSSLEPRKISAQVLFGIEGVTTTQILKQPDVLMLLYLMHDQFNTNQLKVNHDYYTPRTDLTFGSSLGPSIQSAITCRLRDCEQAYKYFITAAGADMKDVRGNAGDGIHGASAGGIWQSIVFGFAGLEVYSDRWEINPCLPRHWKRLVFHFTFHGEVQTVDIPKQEDGQD